MLQTANIPLTEQEEQTLQWIAAQPGTTPAMLLQQAVQRLIAAFQPPSLPIAKRKQRQYRMTKQAKRTPPANLKGSVIFPVVLDTDLFAPVVSDEEWEASFDRTARQIAGDPEAFK